MIGCSMICDYRRGTTSDILRFHEFLETIWIKEYNNQSMQKKDLETNTILVRMTYENIIKKCFGHRNKRYM